MSSACRAVLVVDDEPLIGRIIGEILRSAGFFVEVHSDPRQAAARLTAGWDVLLTDLSMPGMDGTALVREARLRAPRTAVVMMSADPVALRYAGTCADRLLPKPFDTADLVDAVNGLAPVAMEAEARRRSSG